MHLEADSWVGMLHCQGKTDVKAAKSTKESSMISVLLRQPSSSTRRQAGNSKTQLPAHTHTTRLLQAVAP